MAKADNSGSIIMFTIFGAITLWLLNYLITSAATYFHANVYLLYAFVIFQVAQILILSERSSKRFRRSRKGMITYKLHRTPLLLSAAVSGAMAILLFIYLYYANTDSFVRQMVFVFSGALCLAPMMFVLSRLISYGNHFIRITSEDILYQHGKGGRKFSFQEIVSVDYIIQIKDIRHGYVKVGVTMKLVDGHEWEINTWEWGWSDKQVLQLTTDINDQIVRSKGEMVS